MTDMITVSRKDIERIVKQLQAMNVSIAQSTDELRALLDKAEVGESIGEMKENGVTWFKQNPHAYPVGTKFYTTPQPSRIAELEALANVNNEKKG